MKNAGHAVVGWVLAAGVCAASLWFPVSVLRVPVVTSLSPDQVASYVVTIFDVWGGSTTTTTGAGLSVEVRGGPNYAAAIIPCAVVLLAAGATGLLRRGPRAWVASTVTSVAAPVAAGALAAIAGCQLLAYEAAMRPSPPGGLYGGGEQRPDAELGWSFWLLTVAAVLAVAACGRVREPTPPAQPTPPLEARPGADLDPAVFRRPVPDRPQPDHPEHPGD